VGSANLNNRSFGLDSECDVTIDTALPANTGKEGQIAALRTRLISEHLDVPADAVTGKLAETGSLIATIESLRGEGKTLELLDLEKPGPFDCFIADNELLDPEHPDKFLEPISQRGLRKTWAEGLRKVRGTGWRRRDRS
jgi:phosphatidylserine/phosphatidylglycerophosphate/cardiolipin synthase-like enzyme